MTMTFLLLQLQVLMLIVFRRLIQMVIIAICFSSMQILIIPPMNVLIIAIHAQKPVDKNNPCPRYMTYSPDSDTCLFVATRRYQRDRNRNYCLNQLIIPEKNKIDLAIIPNKETNELICDMIKKVTPKMNNFNYNHVSKYGLFFGLKLLDEDKRNRTWGWERTHIGLNNFNNSNNFSNLHETINNNNNNNTNSTFQNWRNLSTVNTNDGNIYGMINSKDCKWDRVSVHTTGGIVCEIYNLDPCNDQNGGCDRVPGSYCVKTGLFHSRCDCYAGYEYNDNDNENDDNDNNDNNDNNKKKKLECVDVNECEIYIDVCGRRTCRNIIGSFRCGDCKPEFELQDHMCMDKNECTQDLHNCSRPYRCVNVIGGYRCAPKDRYEEEFFVFLIVLASAVMIGGFGYMVYRVYYSHKNQRNSNNKRNQQKKQDARFKNVRLSIRVLMKRLRPKSFSEATATTTTLRSDVPHKQLTEARSPKQRIEATSPKQRIEAVPHKSQQSQLYDTLV